MPAGGANLDRRGYNIEEVFMRNKTKTKTVGAWGKTKNKVKQHNQSKAPFNPPFKISTKRVSKRV